MQDPKAHGGEGLPRPVFPSLPIVQVGPADPQFDRKTQSEKYGGLLYLGVGGLAVLAGLIGWFGYGVWSTRQVWRDVYLLHDAERPEVERVAAAERLAADPAVNDRQRWDMALKRDLPPQARYLLAESLTAGAIEGDPRGYAMSVARSEGWPAWLRLLLLRPLALGATGRVKVPPEPMRELAASDDPVIALWANYARAAGLDPAPEASEAIKAAESDPATGGLAILLSKALMARDPADRSGDLAEATRWVRANHPASAEVWAEGASGSEGGTARELQPSEVGAAGGQPRG